MKVVDVDRSNLRANPFLSNELFDAVQNKKLIFAQGAFDPREQTGPVKNEAFPIIMRVANHANPQLGNYVFKVMSNTPVTTKLGSQFAAGSPNFNEVLARDIQYDPSYLYANEREMAAVFDRIYIFEYSNSPPKNLLDLAMVAGEAKYILIKSGSASSETVLNFVQDNKVAPCVIRKLIGSVNNNTKKIDYLKVVANNYAKDTFHYSAQNCLLVIESEVNQTLKLSAFHDGSLGISEIKPNQANYGELETMLWRSYFEKNKNQFELNKMNVGTITSGPVEVSRGKALDYTIFALQAKEAAIATLNVTGIAQTDQAVADNDLNQAERQILLRPDRPAMLIIKSQIGNPSDPTLAM